MFKAGRYLVVESARKDQGMPGDQTLVLGSRRLGPLEIRNKSTTSYMAAKSVLIKYLLHILRLFK